MTSLNPPHHARDGRTLRVLAIWRISSTDDLVELAIEHSLATAPPRPSPSPQSVLRSTPAQRPNLHPEENP